jgi:hypothetical protein
MITTVPMSIKRAFRRAGIPTSGEERLWRERAARMTLDALGHTNLTVKPHDHNETVRYARRWFRGIYDDMDDPKMVDNAAATFDYGGIDFPDVKRAVLSITPIVFEPEEDDDINNDPSKDSPGNIGLA